MNAQIQPQKQIEERILDFKRQYKKNSNPVEVSFREIFPELNRQDRYSHLLHPYPAKLLFHIPHFFLNNSYFSQPSDTVLDPFCGSGTVLLEATLAGRKALGADANPLARLIATVKTRKYYQANLEKTLTQVLTRAKRFRKGLSPDLKNIGYWFSDRTSNRLGRLVRSVLEISNKNHKEFFLVCLSNCARKVSFADPRVNVPVKLNPDRFQKGTAKYKSVKKQLKDLEEIDVFTKFEKICEDNFGRLARLGLQSIKIDSKVVSKDARVLTKSINSKERISKSKIDLVITSPPYAGAQKYIRSSSFGLAWLKLANQSEISTLERENIGREMYSSSECKKLETTGMADADILLQRIFTLNPERAKIASKYLIEMKVALSESIRVLKKDGYLILVIGNNQVCNLEFNTQQYLSDFIVSKGLQIEFKLIDGIQSYGLMTKRNKTADIITREYVLVFKK